MCIQGMITTECFFFFFKAEDGIRDSSVTGVQTCALPIFPYKGVGPRSDRGAPGPRPCRERARAAGPRGGRIDRRRGAAGGNEERGGWGEGRAPRGAGRIKKKKISDQASSRPVLPCTIMGD